MNAKQRNQTLQTIAKAVEAKTRKNGWFIVNDLIGCQPNIKDLDKATQVLYDLIGMAFVQDHPETVPETKPIERKYIIVLDPQKRIEIAKDILIYRYNELQQIRQAMSQMRINKTHIEQDKAALAEIYPDAANFLAEQIRIAQDKAKKLRQNHKK